MCFDGQTTRSQIAQQSGHDEDHPGNVADDEEDADENEEITPVLLVPPGVETPMRSLVINLRSDLPPPGYARVLEIVPADESAREPARKRWLEYKKLGFELKRNDM